MTQLPTTLFTRSHFQNSLPNRLDDSFRSVLTSLLQGSELRKRLTANNNIYNFSKESSFLNEKEIDSLSHILDNLADAGYDLDEKLILNEMKSTMYLGSGYAFRENINIITSIVKKTKGDIEKKRQSKPSKLKRLLSLTSKFKNNKSSKETKKPLVSTNNTSKILHTKPESNNRPNTLPHRNSESIIIDFNQFSLDSIPENGTRPQFISPIAVIQSTSPEIGFEDISDNEDLYTNNDPVLEKPVRDKLAIERKVGTDNQMPVNDDSPTEILIRHKTINNEIYDNLFTIQTNNFIIDTFDGFDDSTDDDSYNSKDNVKI